MCNGLKCIEYYFDSKKFTEMEVIQTMEKEKKEFPKKKIEVEVFLNRYGIYIAKLTFFNNDISLIKRNKTRKIKNYNENRNNKKDGYRKYGQYKTTKTYMPI